jgi:hypothetical protein
MRKCDAVQKGGWWSSAVTGVCVCAVVIAAPPKGVDNAALLYYQAGFACPTPEDVSSFNEVLGGAAPNERVREFLTWRSTQDAIGFVEAAVQIPRCDWGIRLAQGDDLNVPASAQLQRLANLLDVQARVLASDGKSRMAFERCLMLRRFAAQMGDETPNIHHRSRSLDISALRCIRSILSWMPVDAEALVWLQGRLQEAQGTLWLPAKTLTGFRDHCINWLAHEYPNTGVTWKEAMLSSIDDESVKQEIRGLTGDQLFRRACDSYDTFLKSALETIESNKPYAEKDAELRKMEADLHARGTHGDPVNMVVACMYNPAGLVVSYHEAMVRHAANFNLTTAAIEIYLAKARTGKLPTVLPTNQPKDPYSGKDLEYAMTKEGFVLRYRTTGDSGETIRPFEFTVR